MTSARPPRASTSARAASRRSRPRAIRPMRAPASAKRCAMARPSPAEAPVMTTTSPLPVSEELMHLVPEQRERDATAMRLTARQRLGQVLRLIHRYAGGHRRLERIDDSFDKRWALRLQRCLECVPHLLRLLATESNPAACLGEFHEVDRLQLYSVLGIPEEDHLLPLDHPQCVVLDDDDGQRQTVLHRRGKFAHEHRETTVADKGDALAIGKCNLRRNRVREAGRHRRKIPREREELPAPDLDVTRYPGRDGSTVRSDDCVIR